MTDKTYERYLNSENLYNFRDKEKNIRDQISYMLLRTASMFKWQGLPETVPEEYLELYLQTCGICGFMQVDGEYYVFTGGLGGEPDPYYQPTLFTTANPALNISGEYKIGVDCEIIKNDKFYKGLIPMFRKYASQLTENELSLNMASINTRIQQLLLVKDDATKKAADKFLDDIIKGELASMSDKSFFDDGTKTLPLTTTSGSNIIGDLIEYEQYLKASWYNEMGLNANYNMKREALNSAESSINDDILFPLVDEMLEERKRACERINKHYGLELYVELKSSWKDNKKEEAAEIEALDPENNEEFEESEDKKDKEEQEEKDGEED